MALLVTAITWLFTPVGLMCIVHYLAAFKPKLLPDDVQVKFGKTLKVWCKITGQNIPPQLFFGFIGTCKLAGLVAIHGLLGPSLDMVANLCWLVLLAGAAVTHQQQGESLVAPLACLGMMAVRALLLAA
mmetsp:Transcript_27805/g.80154  ORF Transcript_27805/g.80154 Transcript_27805/m.80154 type:complete len:129 (-) Transcript_27805:57-443(-)